MSRMKAEIRVATTQALGGRVIDLFEGARVELERLRGARAALGEAARKLEAHLQVVDRDADASELSPEERAVAKRYVDQCGGIVRNLAAAAEAQVLIVQGKVAGFEQCVREVKKEHDQARARLLTLDDETSGEAAAGDAEGNGEARPARAPGEHPGDPLEARRAEGKRGRRRSSAREEKGNGTDA